jgi:hypothetical protein
MNVARTVWRLRHLAVLTVLAAGAACGQASPEASATASAKAPAKEAEPAMPAGSCGKSGLPDCPLQAWMKGTLQASLKAGDLARLGDALDELARAAPHGFEGWAASARSAATAAKGGDVEAVRAQCRACHDQFRSKFRAEMRGARLF